MAAQLFFSADEVPVGIRTNLFLPGNDSPETHEGSPVVFRVLYGGIPMRKKIYLDGTISGFGIDGATEGVRFSPEEVYSAENAPTGKRYLPFVNGRRVQSDAKNPHPAEVVKYNNDVFYFSCCFPFQQLDVTGIPAYEEEARLYSHLSDEALVGFSKNPYRGLSVFAPLTTAEFRGTTALEILARRHREKDDVGLVELLEQIGNKYLTVCELPADALLVPHK